MNSSGSELRQLVAVEQSLVGALREIEAMAGDGEVDRRVVRALLGLAKSVEALSGLVGEQYGVKPPDGRVAAANAAYAALAAAQDDEDTRTTRRCADGDRAAMTDQVEFRLYARQYGKR